MTNSIGHSLNIYLLIKDHIAKEYDLEHDDPALLDTLEGITDLQEIITLTCRAIKDTQAQQNGLQTIIDANNERMARLERRCKGLRAAVSNAMQESGLTKIMAPDMTIGQQKGCAKVFVTEDDALNLPAEYRKEKTTYSPDKEAIKDALDRGETLSFAHISNGDPILTIRTK